MPLPEIPLDTYLAYRDLALQHPGKDISHRLAEKLSAAGEDKISPEEAGTIILKIEQTAATPFGNLRSSVPPTQYCLALLNNLGSLKIGLRGQDSRIRSMAFDILAYSVLPHAVISLPQAERESLLRNHEQQIGPIPSAHDGPGRDNFLSSHPHTDGRGGTLSVARYFANHTDITVLKDLFLKNGFTGSLLVRDKSGYNAVDGSKLGRLGPGTVPDLLLLFDVLKLSDFVDNTSLSAFTKEPLDPQISFFMAAQLLKRENFTAQETAGLLKEEARRTILEVFQKRDVEPAPLDALRHRKARNLLSAYLSIKVCQQALETYDL
jgi:hypothetical protein